MADVIERFKLNGSVDSCSKNGRPQIVSARERQGIIHKIKKKSKNECSWTSELRFRNLQSNAP